jgi:hypothetical protein
VLVEVEGAVVDVPATVPPVFSVIVAVVVVAE